MCGIVGVVTKASNGFLQTELNVFKQLLTVGEIRGDDATGVIYASNSNDFGIAKTQYSAYYSVDELFKTDCLSNAFQQGKVLVGHNRKATIGGTKEEFAHPFVVKDKFAMVHNGTLSTHKTLAEFESDSEALANYLEPFLKEGDKEKLEEALGKIWGAYAIVGYHQETQKLYLLRNKDRPLSYCETPHGIFFASEAGMLEWILRRNNMYSANSDIQDLPVDTLLTICCKTNTIVKETLSPKKPIVHQNASHMGKWTAWETTVHATPANRPMKPMGLSAVTVVKPSNDVISKQALKRLRKLCNYKKIEFWANDWIEKNPTIPIDVGMCNGSAEVVLYGDLTDEYEEYFKAQIGEIKVYLEADIDLWKHKEVLNIENFDSDMYTGFISDISIMPGVLSGIKLKIQHSRPVRKPNHETTTVVC